MAIRFALTLVVVGLLATPALAEMVSYSADLKGANEVPPNDSPASGTVDATFDTDSRTLKWTVEYSGLTGPATAAHFHGPADAKSNAGPIITLEPAKLASPAMGEAKLTEAQAADLAKGMWYLNVHTAKHPPGEIRGQLMKK
jgi:hypothetical protein